MGDNEPEMVVAYYAGVYPVVVEKKLVDGCELLRAIARGNNTFMSMNPNETEKHTL